MTAPNSMWNQQPPAPHEAHPQPVQGPPVQGYPHPPAGQYGPSQQGYGAPVMPAGQYEPSQQGYGAPVMPAGQYGPPQQGYGAPVMPAASAPGVGGVIVGTIFLGVFGALFAASRAKKAAKLGLSGSKYWIAFGATLGAVWLVGLMFIVAASGGDSGTTASTGGEPGSRTGITAEVLEKDIITNGDFKMNDGSKATVKAATCTSSNVNEGGVGTYRCMIDFADDSRQSFEVTVGENGKWVTDSGN